MVVSNTCPAKTGPIAAPRLALKVTIPMITPCALSPKNSALLLVYFTETKPTTSGDADTVVGVVLTGLGSRILPKRQVTRHRSLREGSPFLCGILGEEVKHGCKKPRES